MDKCAAGRSPEDCQWVRRHVRDVYGVRQGYWVCTTCKAGRWTTETSPTTLGDHTRRED